MDNQNLIERHPVFVFYILTFVFSWLGWIPQTLYARGILPFDSPLFGLLGGAGPTLAAIVVLATLRKKDEIRGLLASLFQMNVSPWWFVVVFGFWLVVVAVALGIGVILGRVEPVFEQFAWGSLFPIFIAMLVSNVWEEIGWRGFALPRLQRKYSDLKITFMMGLLWSLWHLPLLLNPSSPMAGLPWYGEVIFSLSLTVLYIWLYLNTACSLLFVSIFHAMSNTIAFALLEIEVFVSSYLFVVGMTTLVAIVIILMYGTQRFVKLP